jgi:GxxExxY protein
VFEKGTGAAGLGISGQTVAPAFYKGEPLPQGYQPDLLVSRGIVTELKAVQNLAPEHDAQLLNYLKALPKRVGYLINFGHYPSLEGKRMVL